MSVVYVSAPDANHSENAPNSVKLTSPKHQPSATRVGIFKAIGCMQMAIDQLIFLVPVRLDRPSSPVAPRPLAFVVQHFEPVCQSQPRG